jgi:DNA-binding PadR family transcriptional regulator
MAVMATSQPWTAQSSTLRLSLAEHVVLALVGEGPTHGFAVARLLGEDDTLGQIFHVPRPMVYRALDRLMAARLVQVAEVEATSQGPRRTRYRITRTGRKEADTWLSTPVAHIRDIRTEFLLKLVLLERAEADVRPLVRAQREVVAPIVAALRQRSPAGSYRVVNAWRYQTARATLRFLDQLA